VPELEAVPALVHGDNGYEIRHFVATRRATTDNYRRAAILPSCGPVKAVATLKYWFLIRASRTNFDKARESSNSVRFPAFFVASSMLALIAELEIQNIMPQLIVRQIEERVVKKLKQQAGEHGVSTEEEHRRILRESLLGKARRRRSFKEALLAMPDVGEDEDFERGPQLERPVEL